MSLCVKIEPALRSSIFCREASFAIPSTEGKVLWDICTGSGCIGLGLKRACPTLSVVMSDFCPKALAVARQNAERNQLAVELRLGDLLEPFRGQKADYIICNPPYVSRQEFESLSPSVRDHEPHRALLAGEKGTEFYERLARELPAFLNPGAHIFFEIGCSQGEAIQEIFSTTPWRAFSLMKDWAGHNRFFFLEIE